MPIIYDPTNQTFTLQTQHTTYQMKVGAYGVLLHTYYGPRNAGPDLSYTIQQRDRGLSGNPPEAGSDRTFSLDVLPQEYSTFGTGDYRESALDLRHEDGSIAGDLRYVSYEIHQGVPALPGLPALREGTGGAETLTITLEDRPSQVQVQLSYVVLSRWDIIARSAKILNLGHSTVVLERALSCCLDFHLPQDWDMISLYGRHNSERNYNRHPIPHGKTRVDSLRGTSSHQENPFLLLCHPDTTETNGSCYGLSFVYSGNFLAQVELDQFGQLRAVMGIHPQGFSWPLSPGEFFQTPQVLCTMSPNGLELLSDNLHQTILSHILPATFAFQRPPILVNSWEATYFDFDKEKLLSLAQVAKDLGMEMLVLDDGWFGHRNNDESSLGDWYVNTNKLPKGLADLACQCQNLGISFGLWVEPEMISHDSDLYRAHPEWQLQCPGRESVKSRAQYVLDMGRPQVRDYLLDRLSAVITEGNCQYLKWDMNRSLANVWSQILPPARQGETWHRYVLGVYDLLERLQKKHPNLLMEGCSSGGGRFDLGMLYYTPQIWCSDNTDAIDRISIQMGTSLAYPLRTMGSHVSACPNHQTHRTVPLETRGAVAMVGAFGYELDLCQLCSTEKDIIRQQILAYRRDFTTNCHGRLYRLVMPWDQKPFVSWMTVSQDKGNAIVTCVLLHIQSNGEQIWFPLRGLEEGSSYQILETGVILDGTTLMTAGISIPETLPEFGCIQWHLCRIS